MTRYLQTVGEKSFYGSSNISCAQHVKTVRAHCNENCVTKKIEIRGYARVYSFAFGTAIKMSSQAVYYNLYVAVFTRYL